MYHFVKFGRIMSSGMQENTVQGFKQWLDCEDLCLLEVDLFSRYHAETSMYRKY